jgi:hypothetical protein
VLEPLDAVGVEPTGDHGGGVHTSVIPIEKPLLGHHLRPFQLQTLYSMGSRKRPGVNPPIIGYGGGHRGDENRSANGFLEEEMARPMARPCLLNNSVSLQRTQALVPVGSFHCFFYFCKAFAGSGEISDEVLHPCYI